MMNDFQRSWSCKSLQGNTINIELTDAGLNVTSDNNIHTHSFPELFASYNPLEHIPLKDQEGIFEFISKCEIPHLQGKAFHCLEFWKSHPLINFTGITYTYETKISDSYKWQLEISASGILYKDISGSYGLPGAVYEQTLADFWFYGPLMPVPDITLRSGLLDQIKAGVGQSGFSFLESHFPLITYPDFIRPPEWVDGDYIVSDFVIMRPYGVEYGRQNFHDGLVFLSFASYEHCLTRSDVGGQILTLEIIASIKEEL